MEFKKQEPDLFPLKKNTKTKTKHFRVVKKQKQKTF